MAIRCIFGHVQFDHHYSSTLVLLRTSILEGMEVIRLFEFIRLAGYYPVLCLLDLYCSQEIDWPRYGSDYSPFFGYDYKTG